MPKRIAIVTLGLLSILAGVYASGMAYELGRDVLSHTATGWAEVAGVAVSLFVAVCGFGLGAEFLHFGATGEASVWAGRVKLAILTVAGFLPGFVFSFPLTAFYEVRVAKNSLNGFTSAVTISACIGVLTSVAFGFSLWRKRNEKPPPPSQ
jgi:cytochrome bd-type quinol oxidase subunit 2